MVMNMTDGELLQRYASDRSESRTPDITFAISAISRGIPRFEVPGVRTQTCPLFWRAGRMLA
jgi:hypothetical protein